MKILMVCTASRVFGAETMSLNLLDGFRRAGHECVALTTIWTDGEFGRRLKTIGVREVSLPLGTLSIKPAWQQARWMTDTFTSLPKLWAGMRRLYREFQPDVLILNNPKHSLLLHPWLGKQPSVLLEHSSKATDRPNRMMYAVLARKLSRFVSTSDFMVQQLRALRVREDQTCVIKIGAFTREALLALARPAGAQPETGQPVRFGIAGQVSPHKGHDCLLAAAVELKRHGAAFEVRVFGDGPVEYVAQLKECVAREGLSGCWRWMGYQTEIANVYRNMDVCVVPSCFDEPFGMVAVEAAAYGLPVVASRRGGLPEIVVDGETGYLVESGVAAALAERLHSLCQNPALRCTMGQAGYQRALNCFTIEQSVAEFERLFRELAAGRNN